MKEILIKLRDNLEPFGGYRFMCVVLDHYCQTDCEILETSGLKELWLSRGHSAGYAWELKSMPSNLIANSQEHKDYNQELYKEKIECLNIIIGRL
jgi:hypothetical protein